MAKAVDNPVLVSRLTSIQTGEEIQIIRYTADYYEAHFTERNITYHGTLEQILEKIWEE